MTTRTDVINDALEWLGETPSTGEDDASTWVVRLDNAFDREARKLFETHTWNFCQTMEQLAAVEPTPVGWDYGYQKPTQCWRIIRVTATDDPMADNVQYVDREGRIMSNATTAYLTYVKGAWLSEPGSWPEVFAGALAAQMAYKCAPVTGKSSADKGEIYTGARKALSAAKLWDAQQNPAWRIPPGRYERARYGLSRRYDR